MKRLLIYALAVLLPIAPVYAQGKPLGSSSEPIEINADSLEVRQQDNLAIFTGNVIAVQGTTKLKSDKMTVYYRKKEGGEQAPAASEGFAPGQNSVERIEVENNVLLTTSEETASGDRGVYDVDKHQVRLIDNVVLTRGKNVLKGTTLVHDLDTGKSVVNSPAVKEGAQGRVRALFVPEKKNGQKGAQ